MDNYYQIEVKLTSKNGWFTPDEARRHYGKYDRSGITVHWWGDGSGADNHDNTVNYLNRQGLRGLAPTTNYVLSDNKITLCVDPENVAWTSSNGNATTIGIEAQPTLLAEGYKKFGWLVVMLEKRIGRSLQLYPHNFWTPTQCPGTLSLDIIKQEADKWRRGVYTPVTPPPVVTPPVTSAELYWTPLPGGPAEYICNKQPTNMWNFNQTSWGGFTKPVKQFNRGDKVTIFGQVFNSTLKANYLLTEFSYGKKIPNGFNIVDMSLPIQPTPIPVPIPAPAPVVAEWIKNLRDIDDTKMWITKSQALIDIKTGEPATIPAPRIFAKDEEFIASALTIVGNKEYRITDYSFKKGVFNGVPTTSLTLTAPGVPNIPPAPEVPPAPKPIDEETRNLLQSILAGLTAIGKLIADFLSRRK